MRRLRIDHRHRHRPLRGAHVAAVDVDREDVGLLILPVDLLELRCDTGDLASAHPIAAILPTVIAEPHFHRYK